MTQLTDFNKQLTEHDLPLLFHFNGKTGANVLDDALSKAEKLFAPYAYLLEDGDGGWVSDNWAKAVEYGYRISDPTNKETPPRTPMNYGQCLVALDKNSGHIARNTCMYLFTKRSGHWNITRRGEGIKSVLGNNVWSDLEKDPDALAKRVNDAIDAIAAFRSEEDNCANFFDQVTKRQGWTPNPDITVLFHLVWPKFYPVWYKGTEDGYSQIPGMDKLLDALSAELDLDRRPINLLSDYAQYASAYRGLLRLYHEFVYKDAQKPLDTPHFDYLTLLLAVLDPCREALRMLLDRKSLVLYGVPGTGKTHTALKELAPALAERNHFTTVQFHPGYSYADFIIGIRPRSDGKNVTYPVEPGILYRLAAEAAIALDNPGVTKTFGDGTPQYEADADGEGADVRKSRRFLLVIDEINRADLSKVLGEVMLQLEYRGKGHTVNLPQHMPKGTQLTSVLTGEPLDDPFEGGTAFYLPENLYLIGTMNHADRSISGFDMALRRRFAWAEHGFNPSSLRQMLKEKCKGNAETAVCELRLINIEAYIARCRQLNGLIENEQGDNRLPLNRDHVIGHTYFAEIVSILRQSGLKTSIASSHLEILWLYYIAPLLEDLLGYEVHQYRGALEELRKLFIARL